MSSDEGQRAVWVAVWWVTGQPPVSGYHTAFTWHSDWRKDISSTGGAKQPLIGLQQVLLTVIISSML